MKPDKFIMNKRDVADLMLLNDSPDKKPRRFSWFLLTLAIFDAWYRMKGKMRKEPK